MTSLDKPLKERTLAHLAEALASGAVTAEALAVEALTAASDGRRTGTQVFIKLDPDKVLAQARAMDQLRAVGCELSPYAGIPISIKDLADVQGEITSAGSQIHANAPAAAKDAPVVARLRKAGFVLMGRTNMSEYAYSGVGLNPHYGTPGNAFDETRVPGGSTSGGGVSVGLGMAALALGSDTGGSVRIPSALNGLAGFKPTTSAVPTTGCFPLSTTLDSIGPLAPTQACCQVVHGIFSGQEEPDAPIPEMRGLRFIVPTNLIRDDADPEVLAAFDQAIETLKSAGAAIFDIPVPEIDHIMTSPRGVNFAAAEAYAVHRDALATRQSEFDYRVHARISQGADISAAEYHALFLSSRAIQSTFAARMTDYDGVLAPTCAILAPKIDALEANFDTFSKFNGLLLRNCTVFNRLNGCAATIPIQKPGEHGIGLMVANPGGADWKTLRMAQAIEAYVRFV